MRNIISLLIVALFQLAFLGGCQQKEGREAGKSVKPPAAGLFKKDFEGEMRMRMSSPEGSQEARLFLSKKGTRFEMDLADPASETVVMSIVTITRPEEPNLIYTLNKKARTYTVIDLDELQEDLADLADEKSIDDITVTKLGTETLLGYTCTRVLITDNGNETEMWLTRELLSAADFARLQYQGSKNRASATFNERLKKAGLEGFPLKIVDKKTGMTTEFTEIEKKTLDAALFEVPEGYEKKESALQMMAPQISDEDMKQLENLQEMMKDKDMQKEMQDVMKNMREQFEGMQMPGR